MIDKLLEDVEKLAAEEMDRANLVHQPFHSRHEGMAVIMEEVEECKIEYEVMLMHLEAMKEGVFHDRIIDADAFTECIYDRALNLAAEAIQVVAMCWKWRKSFVSEVSCKENDS